MGVHVQRIRGYLRVGVCDSVGEVCARATGWERAMQRSLRLFRKDRAFLMTEYKWLSVFCAVTFLFVSVGISFATGVCFVFGAGLSAATVDGDETSPFEGT